MSLISRIGVLLGTLTSVYANSSLLEANRGQFSSNVQFLARNGAISVAVTDSGMAFGGKGGRIALRFNRAISHCAPGSGKESEAHYLSFNPPITNVPRYSSVVCRDVYKGIDWVMRSSGESIEHDWRLAPGADPRDIQLILDGTASAKVTSDGHLLLRSAGLTIVWKIPQSYQEDGGARHPVATRYLVRGRRVRLAVGKYRRDLPLVIDPLIDFSYVIDGNGPGSGSQTGVDGAGNIYLAGTTLASDFQTTSGAAFPKPGSAPNNSDTQVFVQELAPDGSKQIYSTYLGTGIGAVAMSVDSAGDVYLALNGFADLAVGGGTPISSNGTAFLYKLAPGGGKLIYGTQVLPGFDYTDPVALAVDGTGNAYVGMGSTTIAVAKIDPTGQKQIYMYQSKASNYFGGLAGIAVGGDGTVYLAGTSGEGGLTTTPGVLKATVTNSGFHGYLIRLKSDGSAPIFSTYIAGDYVDTISSLAVDSSGAAYVGGQTSSAESFPGIQGTSLGLSQPQTVSAFVMKVNPQGTTALYSCLLPNSAITAMQVDAAGDLYAAGPLSAPLSGIAALKIDPTGQKLLYYSSIPAPPGTTTGSGPSVLGMALDPSGGAYLAGVVPGIQIPFSIQSTRLQSNAFLLKIDPNPDQCDLSIQTQTGGSFVPGVALNQTFTIYNNGPGAAQNVIFAATVKGSTPGGCRISQTGVCGTDPQLPWASFPSIPAGGSATVELDMASYSAASVTFTAVVSTATSDVNQDNNVTNTSSVLASVPVTMESNLQAYYVLSPAVGPPITLQSTGANVGVAPNSQFQIFWPSPQITSFGISVIFHAWQDGSTDNPRTFTATTAGVSNSADFNFLDTPYFAPAGVANAASNAAAGVSPGELIALYGFSLGQNASAKITNGQFPTTLGGTTVTFDGNPAPLIYSSTSQLNAIVPYEVAGQATTNITVQTTYSTFNTSVPVIQAVPALFTANASGSGQAAALNQNGSVNSPSNPANPGDVIVLYGTGEGLIAPLPKDGTVTSSPAPAPQLPITVTIGGQNATVLYAGEAPGLVSGVIQINAQIPAGIQASHHVPISWNAGNFASQPGVTIAVNDSPSPSFVYPVGVDNLSLAAITIAPSRLAVDSNATIITVTGSGFTQGMVVQWNNQARPTTFLDPTRLQVTLTGADLETPALDSITVWDAAQSNPVSRTVPLLVYLPILNNALVYDPSRDKIYIAVSKTQVPQGPSIAVLNPETGRIESFYSVPADPTTLALSGDGQYLYVALGAIIRRVNVSSWTADLDIPLGQYSTESVSSIVVLPGTNTSIAISFVDPVVVFDGAQMRPTIVNLPYGPNYLLGGPNLSTLYAGDNSGNFYTLALSSSGIKIANTFSGLLGADGDSVYSGGLLYDGWGAALDPSIPSIVETFDNAGLITPVPSLQKVLILGGMPPSGYTVESLPPVLSLNDPATGQRSWSLPLPATFAANHGPMLFWGTNGIVLRESQLYGAPAPGIDLFRVNLNQ